MYAIPQFENGVAINMIKDFMAAKKLIAEGKHLDPVKAAEAEVALKDM